MELKEDYYAGLYAGKITGNKSSIDFTCNPKSVFSNFFEYHYYNLHIHYYNFNHYNELF